MANKLLAIILISVSSVSFAVSSSLIKREVETAYSSEEQAAIVEKHNEYRRTVTPTASNMAELKWDADLTSQAQDLADKCVFEHSVTAGIGQNMYCSTGKPDVTAPITSWHEEVEDYTYVSNKCVLGQTCGHYTQVVWAGTTAVGCGIKYCPSIPQLEGRDGWIVVCNYKPGGNYKGQWPYESGDQCSQCSGGKPCKNGLCSDCSTQSEEDCECKIECQNGLPNFGAKCECECEAGFYGERCEFQRICEEDDDLCGANPGYPSIWCSDSEHTWILDKCPRMCGVC